VSRIWNLHCMYVTSVRRPEGEPDQIMERKSETSLCLRAGTTLPPYADFMASLQVSPKTSRARNKPLITKAPESKPSNTV
jgi:hypothetical protein